MFGEFIEELQKPSLLKPFDEVFELQLPLRNAKLKFHSKVGRIHVQISSTFLLNANSSFLIVHTL